MRGSRTSWPALTALALAALVTACVCDESSAVFSADWEYCSGTCEWRAEGEGSARVIETLHPGEHGIELDGAVTLVTETAVTSGTVYNDGLWLEYTSDCAGAPSARWRGLEGSRYALQVTLPRGAASGGGRFRRHLVSLPPVPGLEPADPWSGQSNFVIASLALENRAGVCVIDQLRLMVANECYW